MNTQASNLRALAIPALLAVWLAGCASTSSPGANAHSAHGSSAGASTLGGAPTQPGAAMDMQAMCDKHQQQMAGKSQAQRQAMMEEHMRSMSPEMRTRMQTMMAQCRQ